jgi:hypothetical protein
MARSLDTPERDPHWIPLIATEALMCEDGGHGHGDGELHDASQIVAPSLYTVHCTVYCLDLGADVATDRSDASGPDFNT